MHTTPTPVLLASECTINANSRLMHCIDFKMYRKRLPKQKLLQPMRCFPMLQKYIYITANIVTVLVKRGNTFSYVFFIRRDANNIALIGPL